MILHITHNDLDGAGCTILMKKVYGAKIEYFSMNYDEIDNFLLENYQRYEKIFITDVSPSLNIFEKIRDEKEIILIDHHKTSENFKKYDNVYHEIGKCGTLLTLEYLEQLENINLKEYYEFVRLVNDYDLWLLKDNRSLDLNKLFYLYGFDNFVDRFLENPSVDLDEKEVFVLNIENERQQKYIENVSTTVREFIDKEGRKFGVVFAEQYNSELGHFLINEKGYDYVFIINIQKGKISLRSKKDVDVAKIAVANGGGGHKNAAGFSTGFDFCLEKFLKEVGVL